MAEGSFQRGRSLLGRLLVRQLRDVLLLADFRGVAELGQVRVFEERRMLQVAALVERYSTVLFPDFAAK